MRDHDPILLHRMLELRQCPLFAAPELEELANVAENAVEHELDRGATVATAGARVDALALIVEGRLETRDRARAWRSRELFGLLETLASRPAAVDVIAADDTRVLWLSSADLAELLEDNHGFMTATLRELAARVVALGGRPPGAFAGDPPDGALGLIDRLRILRRQVPFATARLQALTRLAHGSEELRWPQGAELARAGDPARRAVMLVDGELRTRGRDGVVVTYRAGDVIGLYETLARGSHPSTLEVIAPVRALVASGDELLDVVEDHADLGLAMLRALAAVALDG